MPISTSTLEDIREDSLNGLTVAQPPIGVAGARELADALAGNTALHTLNLDNHELGDAGIALIAKALEKNTGLHTLSLRNNDISAEGLKALGKAVAGHPSLHTLNLGTNPLGDAGIENLMAGLGKNHPLRRLFIDKTGISADGAGKIAEAMKAEGGLNQLNTLNISYNDITQEGAVAIAKTLEGNASLLTLHIAGNASDDTSRKLSGTIRASGNQNLIHITMPKVDNELQQMLARNKETGEYLAHRFQWKKDSLTPKELRQISVRLPIIAHFIDVDTALVRESFDHVVSKLPTMPDAASLPAGLFQPAVRNYAPLDNPRLWKDGEEAKRCLNDMTLSKDFLSLTTPYGTTFLDALANALPAGEFMGELNKRGIKLGADELLDAKGEPNGLMTTLMEQKNGIASLFSVSNWMNQPIPELRKVHSALPEGSANVPLHSLQQAISHQKKSVGLGR